MKIIVTLWLLSSFALAAQLSITGPHFSKTSVWVQLKANFTDDSGLSRDVTNEVTWSSTRAQTRVLGDGRVRFALPPYGQLGVEYSEQVNALYKDDGHHYTASHQVRVDLSPDFLTINGSRMVAIGSVQQFRSTGSFSGQQVDLTRRGTWSAQKGRMTSWGMYSAVGTSSPGDSDTITFRVGNKSTSFQITLQ